MEGESAAAGDGAVEGKVERAGDGTAEGKLESTVESTVEGTVEGTAEDLAPTTGAGSGSSAVLGDVSIQLDLTPANPSTPADLDPQQRAVVEHRGAPLLVLAGPGTGKTTTLIEAMVARLQGPDRLRPEQVLGLTFGRQAAADWRDRLISRLGGGLVPAVSTFHAYAFSLVRQHADQLGLMASPRLLAGHEEDIAVRPTTQPDPQRCRRLARSFTCCRGHS